MTKINMNKAKFKSDARKLTAKELKTNKYTATHWEKAHRQLYDKYWELLLELRLKEDQARGKYSKFMYTQEEMDSTKETTAIWENRYNALKKQFSDFRLEIALSLSEIKTELEDAQQASEMINKQISTTVETKLACGCRPNVEICKKCCCDSNCDICNPMEYVGD